MRRRLVVPLIALVGVAGAVGLGFAVNEISGDSIGLSAEPLEAGESLAPPSASQNRTRRRRGRAERELGRRTAPPADDDRAAPEAGVDDHGGRREDDGGRRRDRGGDSGSSGPGSGSDSSGPGSSDDRSGSSGSGRSGSDD